MFEKLTAADFEPVSARRCQSSGKVKYPTRADARRHAEMSRVKRGDVLYHYRCPDDDCRQWHLTHQPQRFVRPGDPKSTGGRRTRR